MNGDKTTLHLVVARNVLENNIELARAIEALASVIRFKLEYAEFKCVDIDDAKCKGVVPPIEHLELAAEIAGFASGRSDFVIILLKTMELLQSIDKEK